ncbi:MAG: PAS domain S-box protein [Nitrospiraceae bacterium]
MLGILRDVTERRRIEDALRDSEERLRSIVQSTKDAIVLVNALMKVAFWNKGAEATFGYSAEGEMIGQPARDDHPERYHEVLEWNVQRARLVERLGDEQHFGIGRRWKDGIEFPLELSLAAGRAKPICFSR